MLTFIRKITGRVACLCLVLISFEVKDDCMWVRFVSFWWEFVVPPGSRSLVFLSFNQSVAWGSDYFTSFQSSLIGIISCYFVTLFVNTDHFGSLSGIREAMDTTVPMATMELKDSFGCWMIAINFTPCNNLFTPRGHIWHGECECHSVVIHTLASKLLWYQNRLLDKKPSQKLTQGQGSDLQGTRSRFTRMCTSERNALNQKPVWTWPMYSPQV